MFADEVPVIQAVLPYQHPCFPFSKDGTVFGEVREETQCPPSSTARRNWNTLMGMYFFMDVTSISVEVGQRPLHFNAAEHRARSVCGEPG
ncbi:hypothetical protein [Streptomyces sp. NPDC001500]